MIRHKGVQRISTACLALCCTVVLAETLGGSRAASIALAEGINSPGIAWHGAVSGQDEGGERTTKGGRMQQLRHLLQAKRRRRVGSSNEKWVKLHEQLAREVNAADDGKGYDVLFYGDSILESTRGTYLGAAWSEFRQVKEVWDEVFGGKAYSTHTLAISGDSIARLLWRMKNGEVPLKHEPRVAVVLIGTEDLVSPGCADPNAAQKAAAQLRGLLVYMHRRMPAAQIVAMGVLPKGQTWPNTCTEAITAANQRLQECSDRHKPWLHYVDVGDRFLTHQDDGQGHQEIVPSLLTQDTLNPSFYGMRIIASELEALIDELIAQGPGNLGKGVTHIKPRQVPEKVVDRAAARKERAGRKKRRRQKVLNKPRKGSSI